MRRSVENAEHVGLFRPLPWRRNHTHRATTTMPDTRSLDPSIGIASSRLNHWRTTQGESTNTDTFIFVGLFAPRQGQLYREEQRRRRSTYDRGTPGAEFEAHNQHLTDPALAAYPSSSSYLGTMSGSSYDNFPSGHADPGPSNWYHLDY